MHAFAGRGNYIPRLPCRSTRGEGRPRVSRNWLLHNRPDGHSWSFGASLLTTRIGGLHRGYLLIGGGNGCTAMPLFAYEIEFRRRRVTLQTGLFQRRIDHLVSPVLNHSAGCGDLQSKKLPAVRVWKRCAIVLYHCLGRDQLQNCARGIFFIGHAVPEYSDGFSELRGIGILNPRVSHFRQVEQAAKRLFGYHKIIGRKGYGQTETQNEANDATHDFRLSPGDVRTLSEVSRRTHAERRRERGAVAPPPRRVSPREPRDSANPLLP